MSTSTITKNKELVRDFFAAFNAKDIPKAMEVFSDDLDYWIIGSTQVSGHKDKRLIQLGFKMILRQFETFQFITHEFTGEENRVAVTVESKGKHKNGKDYNNHYHFLYVFDDTGKISHVKEYLDTEHATWIEQ